MVTTPHHIVKLPLNQSSLYFQSFLLFSRSLFLSLSPPYSADFPYGQECGNTPGAFFCPSPLVCNSNSRCDYTDLPSGYGCEDNHQCASGLCSSDGFCIPKEKLDNTCEKDDECPSAQFCNNGECSESLALGENCTGFEKSLEGVSRVCQPGTGCLPGQQSNASYSCQPLFSGRYGQYCGASLYKCPYGQFCNQETQKCDYLVTYDGTNLPDSCSSSSASACPSGFKCSCSGESTENGEGQCKPFINTYCPSLFGKYLTCLREKDCYFDPDTLVKNPAKSNSDFLQPLNRFSCASQCQFYYNKFIKCQNSGFEETNTLTPAYVPEFSHHDDAIWAGYQIALLFIGTLVAMILLAAISALLCRPEPTAEDLE